MGDRIVVMSEAEIQQVGTPAEIYYDPANLFVARFIGSPGMNLINGVFTDGTVRMPGTDNQYAVSSEWKRSLERTLVGEGDVVVGFRPESAHLDSEGLLSGQVYATDLHGAYTMLHVNLNEFDIIHIRTTRQVNYPIGTPVRFNIDPVMVRFFNPTTKTAISREVSQ